MKKKYELLKAIMICFLVYVVLSWIVPAGTISGKAVDSSGGIAPVGLFGLFYFPILTIATFIQFGAIALCLGAFYGVLNKTGVYTKLVANIAKKFKGKEKKFLIGIIVLIVLLSSVLGVPYGLLVFVPFIVAILLTLGYDKMTAFAATIGSMLVGDVASTYGLSVATQVANIFTLKVNDNILLKFAFLAVVIFLYVLFIIRKKETKIQKIVTKKTTKSTTKDTKDKKNIKTKKASKDTKEEVKVENKLVIPFAEDVVAESKKNIKPLVIMTIFLAVFLFLSMTNWKYMFNVSLFEDFFNKLKEIKTGDFEIITSILGITNPFGYWTSFELSSTLLIFSLLIAWVYGLKLDDTLDGMKNGAKRMFKTALLISLGSVVFTMMLSGSTKTIFITMAGKLIKLTKGFNLFTISGTALISGFFYNDFYYALNSIATLLTGSFKKEYLPIIGFIFQTIHSLVMIVIPTSLVLLSGLSMFDVSFKEWFKYIIKFVLALLVISIVITVVLVLVV